MKIKTKGVLITVFVLWVALMIFWMQQSKKTYQEEAKEYEEEFMSWYDFGQTNEEANEAIEKSKNIALIIDYEIKELEKKWVFVHDTFKWKCQNYLANTKVRWIQKDIIGESYCFIISH